MKKILIIIGTLLLLCGGILITLRVIKDNKKDNSNNDKTYYIEINYQDFKKLIDDKKTFALIIHQTGCPHCEAYLPVIEDIANHYKINIYGINTSNLEQEDYLAFNNIIRTSGTPTTVFINDGVEKTTVNRLVGDLKSKTVIDRFKALGFIGEDNEEY